MISKTLSSAVLGVDAYIVDVEVDIAMGLPQFTTVGLPDGAVRESKERVRSSIKNCGYDFPARRITVNLAPADIKKDGSYFDLPISLGIISAGNNLEFSGLNNYLILGELSLDGKVKPIKGALPAAISARENGLKGIILPRENAREAAVVKDIDVFAVKNLHEVVEFFTGKKELEKQNIDLDSYFRQNEKYGIDFKDVKGQQHAKRALEVAASGAHNALLIGSPGTGKTMLARRIPSILTEIRFEEALETSKIYSVIGLLPKDSSFISRRPFRAPHHTISDAGLIGGGAIPKPGEVSLAHNGVLFLDELPEFKKNVIEVLRQPVEDGRVTISRATTSITYPSNFMLVAAMNPCPCGYLGDRKKECTCTPIQVQRYRSKVSGPLLDRFDIQVEVPSVDYKELSDNNESESSKTVRQRVNDSRNIQSKRFRDENIFSNSEMSPSMTKKYCKLNDGCKKLLETAIDKLGLSARAYDRILKVSRTIADLDRSKEIQTIHISEAIQYRSLDKLHL